MLGAASHVDETYIHLIGLAPVPWNVRQGCSFDYACSMRVFLFLENGHEKAQTQSKLVLPQGQQIAVLFYTRRKNKSSPDGELHGVYYLCIGCITKLT